MRPRMFALRVVLISGFGLMLGLPGLAQTVPGRAAFFGFPPPDRNLWTVHNCDQSICEVPLRALNRPASNGDNCAVALADIVVIQPAVRFIVWQLDGLVGPAMRFEFSQTGGARKSVEIVEDDPPPASPVFEDDTSPYPHLRVIKKVNQPAVGRLFRYNVHLDFFETGKPKLECRGHGPLIVNRG